MDEFEPCKLLEHSDKSYSLIFVNFELAEKTFEEMGQEGGGYSWHGVVDALVCMRAPHLAEKLSYDPEGSMFVALSRDREALLQVAKLIAAAIEDQNLLKEAIAHTNPELLD